MISKEMGSPGKVRVTFTMPAAIWAESIHLVGDFNGWSKTATPLTCEDNQWWVSLELDANRAFQYRYLINGREWYNDWRADRYEPNEFGGDNSVVVTTIEREVGSERPIRPMLPSLHQLRPQSRTARITPIRYGTVYARTTPERELELHP
jgi:1,4-alpha-glucan branching enzyme